MDHAHAGHDQIDFAADGRALIVGCVDDVGAPVATRGWGLRDGGDHVVVFVDADDRPAMTCLAAGRRVAVTGADVRTFQSLQIKGVVDGVGPIDDDDRAEIERYIRLFLEAVVEVDGVSPTLVERVRPSTYVACRFKVLDAFDQTPGPGAGAPVVAS